MRGLGDFGRDDGIRCDKCAGPTYLTYDQGYGLRSYRCEQCDYDFSVQFDLDDPEEGEGENY